MAADKRPSDPEADGQPPTKKPYLPTSTNQPNSQGNANATSEREKRYQAVIKRNPPSSKKLPRKKPASLQPIVTSKPNQPHIPGDSGSGQSAQQSQDGQAKKTVSRPQTPASAKAPITTTWYDDHQAPPNNTNDTNEPQYTQWPVSAGRPFAPVPTCDATFLPTIRAFNPSIRSFPAGFSNNTGTNCYRSAVFVALFNSRRFMSYIRGWHIPQEYNQTPLLRDNPLHLLELLRRLSDQVHIQNFKRIDVEEEVKRFFNAVGYPKSEPDNDNLPSSWRVHSCYSTSQEQCDASEFLTWLLQSIAGQLFPLPAALQCFDELTFLRKTERQYCPRCTWPVMMRKKQVRPERTMDLYLPGSNKDHASKECQNAATGRGVISLCDCVWNSVRSILDKDFRCTRCAKEESRGHVVQEFKTQHAPEMLFMVIRRFLNEGHLTSKSFQQVKVPQEIDLGPWLDHSQYGQGTTIKYRLASVVSHQGSSLHAGHYHAYVRGGKAGDEWFEVNDKVVQPVGFKQFCDAQDTRGWSKDEFENRFTPYILVFEKEYKEEVLTAGRSPMNTMSHTPKDEKPPYWPIELEGRQEETGHNAESTTALLKVSVPVSQNNPLDGGQLVDGAEPPAEQGAALLATEGSQKPNDATDGQGSDTADSQHSFDSLFDETPSPKNHQSGALQDTVPEAPTAASNGDIQHSHQPPVQEQTANEQAGERQVMVGSTVNSQQQTVTQGQVEVMPQLVTTEAVVVQTEEPSQNQDEAQTTSAAQVQQTSTPSTATPSTSTQPALTPATTGQTQIDPSILPGLPEDVGSDPAELNIRIRIGGHVIDLPPHQLSHFNKDSEREIIIDTWITAPKDKAKPGEDQSKRKKVVMNATNVMLDNDRGDRWKPWKRRWRALRNREATSIATRTLSGRIAKQNNDTKKNGPPKEDSKKKFKKR